MCDLMQYALIFYDFQLILAQMGPPWGALGSSGLVGRARCRGEKGRAALSPAQAGRAREACCPANPPVRTP